MIKLFKIFLAAFLLCLIISCKYENKDSSNELEDITLRIEKEGQFNDIYFNITNEIKTDSTHIYIIKGLYNKRVVGLQIEIKNNIGAGISNQEIVGTGFKFDAVKFKSIGEESNEFLIALSKLYNIPTTSDFTKNNLTFSVFSLNENAVNLDEKNYYKMKIFYEDGEDTEFEIYLNINTEKGEVELHEKDIEYRTNIIKALAQ